MLVGSLNEGEGRKERKRKHDSLPRSDSRPRSRSRSPDVASKDLKKKKNEKRKRERKSKHAHNKSPNPQEDDAPRKETEEEYDARLEREENERIAARKACELEALKERHVQTQVEEGGVRLKGLGICNLVVNVLISVRYRSRKDAIHRPGDATGQRLICDGLHR